MEVSSPSAKRQCATEDSEMEPWFLEQLPNDFFYMVMSKLSLQDFLKFRLSSKSMLNRITAANFRPFLQFERMYFDEEKVVLTLKENKRSIKLKTLDELLPIIVKTDLFVTTFPTSSNFWDKLLTKCRGRVHAKRMILDEPTFSNIQQFDKVLQTLHVKEIDISNLQYDELLWLLTRRRMNKISITAFSNKLFLSDELFLSLKTDRLVLKGVHLDDDAIEKYMKKVTTDQRIVQSFCYEKPFGFPPFWDCEKLMESLDAEPIWSRKTHASTALGRFALKDLRLGAEISAYRVKIKTETRIFYVSPHAIRITLDDCNTSVLMKYLYRDKRMSLFGSDKRCGCLPACISMKRDLGKFDLDVDIWNY